MTQYLNHILLEKQSTTEKIVHNQNIIVPSSFDASLIDNSIFRWHIFFIHMLTYLLEICSILACIHFRYEPEKKKRTSTMLERMYQEIHFRFSS